MPICVLGSGVVSVVGANETARSRLATSEQFEKAAPLTSVSWPALSERKTDSPTFAHMAALVLMAVAVFVVVLVDGAMLAYARRH